MLPNIKICEMDDRISQKFEDRSIKIPRVNLILITKSALHVNLHSFTLILFGFGVRCGLNRFSVLSPL